MSNRTLQKLMVTAPVVALVAFVVLEAVPNFVRARTDVSRNPCVNILRSIDAATKAWALDNGKTTNDTPTWEDIRPYLSPDGRIPSCPQGGTYTLGRKGTPSTCSYPGHTLQ